MKILLIGANGQLGNDLIKTIPADVLIPLTHKDIEILDFAQTEEIIKKYQPNIIINTSAYHKVDECETNEKKSLEINAIAVKNLALICKKIDAALVHFSTDYVFGLNKDRKIPYSEIDNPGPLNAYGVSKLAGEYFIQYVNPKYFIIRTCGLYGSAGSSGKGGNFVETMMRLGKEKNEVKVVNDQILTPTYTKDLAKNVWALIQTDHYGLYHMTSEGYCSWYEFAAEIFALTNNKVKCTAVSSSVFPTPATRPGYSVLENNNLNKIKLNNMRNWQEALKDYLMEKKYIKI